MWKSTWKVVIWSYYKRYGYSEFYCWKKANEQENKTKVDLANVFFQV